jgi:hypothetical protein
VRPFRVAWADAPCFVNCNKPEALVAAARANRAAGQCRADSGRLHSHL